MRVETDEGGRQSIHVTLPTLGLVSSIAGAIIFCGGWIFGYMTFKADMNLVVSQLMDLKLQTGSIGMRVNTLGDAVVLDRENLTNRLTVLESEVKFISQGVAELKLKVATGAR